MRAQCDAIVDAIERNARRAHPQQDVNVDAIRACDPRLILAYNDKTRVRVIDGRGNVRTGRVSRSTGWRPVLLLMARSNQHGSSDVLGPNDRVLAVQHGRTYVRVSVTPR